MGLGRQHSFQSEKSTVTPGLQALVGKPEYIPFISPLPLGEVFASAGLFPRFTRSPERPLIGVCNARWPAADTLCFVDRPPDAAQRIALTNSAVVTTAEIADGLECLALAICDDPRAWFIDFAFGYSKQRGFASMTSLATVSAGIASSAWVHPNAVLEDEVYIGPGCQVHAGCVIKQGSVLLQDVVLRENCVVGCEGIARYVARDGRVLRFPHLAGVFIGNGAEIGAGCIIARGALTSTQIGVGCVIGNMCNIGHGVQLGDKTWMSVGCLIGGNCRIGKHATLGLGVNLRDNLVIGEAASVAMGSVVMRNIDAGVSVLGNPAKVVPGIIAGPAR